MKQKSQAADEKTKKELTCLRDSTINILIKQWIGIGLSSVSRMKIPKEYCP
jgi:hypothetical protein